MYYRNLIMYYKIINKIFCLLQQNLIGKLIKNSILNSLIKVNFIKFCFGGVKKEISVSLKFERQIKFAINSFIDNSNIKHMKSINLKELVKLFCFSYKFKGPIIKKNYQMYKKAIDNRVFLSFIKINNKYPYSYD